MKIEGKIRIEVFFILFLKKKKKTKREKRRANREHSDRETLVQSILRYKTDYVGRRALSTPWQTVKKRNI